MRRSIWLLAALAAGLLAPQTPLGAQEPLPPPLPPLWEPPADTSLSVAPPPGILLLPLPEPGPAPQASPPEAPPTTEEPLPTAVEEVPLPAPEELPLPPSPEALPAGETPPPVTEPPPGGNQPPTLEVPGAQTVDEGTLLSFAVNASDPDAGQAVSVQTSVLPEGANFDGRTFAWTSGYGQAGSYTASFMALDNGAPPMASAPLSVAITVKDVNRPPVANAGPDQTAECNGPQTSVTLSGAASSDPDGDVLSYSWNENGVELSAQVSPTLSLGPGSHTLTLAVSDGKGGIASDQVVVNLVDTTPPVVTAPANTTAEATGPLTAVVLGTATATDAVGVVSLTNNAPAKFPLGTTTVTWTARDAAGNIGSATQAVLVRDTIAPILSAALIPMSRGQDEDEDGNFYQVSLSATDAVDAQPAISALITQPLTPASPMAISYKREKKNRIKVQAEKKKLVVKLEGPSEQALRALWAQALAAGGFSVSKGQVVQLILKKDKNEYEAQYRLDKNLNLSSAKGPGLKLLAWAMDASGNRTATVEVVPAKSGQEGGLAKRVAGLQPAAFALNQNYPNPCNPSTAISYDLAEAAQVRLTIYNAMGQEVRELVAGTQQPGRYEVQWDGRDNSGQQVASGFYLYRLQAGDQVQVRKMLLVK